MALTDKLVAIADAIREKTGKTDEMTLNQMAVEIDGIASGNTEVEDAMLTRTLTSYENDRITELGRYGLQGMFLLETVSLPNLVKTSFDAFADCTALKHVSLPKYTGLQGGSRMFYRCSSLTDDSFDIPNLIHTNALDFRECTGLTKVPYESQLNYIGDWCFANCLIQSVNLPNVTGIGNSSFYDCKSLVRVDVGVKQRNTLRRDTFNGCSALETCILRADAFLPMDNTSAFKGTPIESGTGYIYVPSALVDQYKAATNWTVYADQIRAIEAYSEITGGL